MTNQTPIKSLQARETDSFDPVVYVKTRFGGPENYTCQQNKELFEWTSDKIHSIFNGGMSANILYLHGYRKDLNDV